MDFCSLLFALILVGVIANVVHRTWLMVKRPELYIQLREQERKEKEAARLRRQRYTVVGIRLVRRFFARRHQDEHVEQEK